MKVRFICKCGLENHTIQDWTAHWRYGIARDNVFLGRHPKLRALWLFLRTKIVFEKKI